MYLKPLQTPYSNLDLYYSKSTIFLRVYNIMHTKTFVHKPTPITQPCMEMYVVCMCPVFFSFHTGQFYVCRDIESTNI
jgi:hypothetical protein